FDAAVNEESAPEFERFQLLQNKRLAAHGIPGVVPGGDVTKEELPLAAAKAAIRGKRPLDAHVPSSFPSSRLRCRRSRRSRSASQSSGDATSRARSKNRRARAVAVRSW